MLFSELLYLGFGYWRHIKNMGIIYYAASDKAQIYYELGKIYSFVTLKPREVEESSFGLKVRSLYRLFPDLKIVTDNHDLLDHPEYRHIGSVFE